MRGAPVLALAKRQRAKRPQFHKKNASSRSGKTGFERFSLAEMRSFDLSKRKNIFTFVKILLAELLFNLSKGLG
jgi:hypothetical protein